jgi:hypothetical protein
MPEPKASSRSRLIVLGAAVAVLAAVVAFTWWPAASPGAGPSNRARDPRQPAAEKTGPVPPLDVRLDALKQPPPEPGGEERNPFRFYVKPPPPPPPRPVVVPSPATPIRVPVVGDADYRPPPPPPMPLKFIGTAEQGKKRVAIFVFSDGRGLPMYAAEGELVAGQYKVVRIGVESVVMQYPDGSGQQTIPMRGGQ